MKILKIYIYVQKKKIPKPFNNFNKYNTIKKDLNQKLEINGPNNTYLYYETEKIYGNNGDNGVIVNKATMVNIATSSILQTTDANVNYENQRTNIRVFPNQSYENHEIGQEPVYGDPDEDPDGDPDEDPEYLDPYNIAPEPFYNDANNYTQKQPNPPKHEHVTIVINVDSMIEREQKRRRIRRRRVKYTFKTSIIKNLLKQIKELYKTNENKKIIDKIYLLSTIKKKYIIGDIDSNLINHLKTNTTNGNVKFKTGPIQQSYDNVVEKNIYYIYYDVHNPTPIMINLANLSEHTSTIRNNPAYDYASQQTENIYHHLQRGSMHQSNQLPQSKPTNYPYYNQPHAQNQPSVAYSTSNQSVSSLSEIPKVLETLKTLKTAIDKSRKGTLKRKRGNQRGQLHTDCQADGEKLKGYIDELLNINISISVAGVDYVVGCELPNNVLGLIQQIKAVINKLSESENDTKKKEKYETQISALEHQILELKPLTVDANNYKNILKNALDIQQQIIEIIDNKNVNPEIVGNIIKELESKFTLKTKTDIPQTEHTYVNVGQPQTEHTYVNVGQPQTEHTNQDYLYVFPEKNQQSEQNNTSTTPQPSPPIPQQTIKNNN
jgi:hypothetical protein